MPPRKKTPAADGESLSTMAVDKDIADQVRDTAKKYGTTTLEITNQLLTFALSHAKVEIEVKKVVIQPAAKRR